jgi:hypothetical protein
MLIGDAHGHSRVGPEEHRQPRQLNIKREREKKENIVNRNSANGAMNEINLARFRCPTLLLFAAWAWGFLARDRA